MVLRVGMIGLGGVSEAHLEAFRGSPEIEVVAGAELRERRLGEISDIYGFNGYVDYREMLDKERLDIACVLTPVNLHRKVVEDCAKFGVHVLCEKPIAISLEDANQMIAACEIAGTKLFYGASYRFLPAVSEARKLILSGAVGDVLLMTESVVGGTGPAGHRPIGYSHYPEGGPGGSGMGLVDHGVHLIDTFAWLTNSVVTIVYGRGNVSGADPATEFVHLTLADGSTGHLLYNDSTFDTDLPAEGLFSHGAAWTFTGPEAAHTWHAHPGCIRVHGTRGSLRIFHYANQLFLNNAEGLRQVVLQDRPPPAQFAIQIESFCQSIREDKQPDVTGKDGVQALRVLLAVYESQRTGRVVNL